MSVAITDMEKIDSYLGVFYFKTVYFVSLQFWQAAGGQTRLWMHYAGAIRNDCGEL